MQKSEEYRELAAECVRVAHIMKDPAEKSILLQMAQIWFELADKADGLRRCSDQAPPD